MWFGCSPPKGFYVGHVVLTVRLSRDGGTIRKWAQVKADFRFLGFQPQKELMISHWVEEVYGSKLVLLRMDPHKGMTVSTPVESWKFLTFS